MIKNSKLNRTEKIWIGTMVSKKFDYKQELLDQVNSADILREYTDYYISLKFNVSAQEKPIIIDAVTPIEMRVYRQNMAPVLFLLHLQQGFLVELEILNADSSKLDKDLDILSAKKEIIYDFI